MRLLIISPDRQDHLLTAMAADTALPAASLDFAATRDDAIRVLRADLREGALHDAVIAFSGCGRVAVAFLDALRYEPVLDELPVFDLGDRRRHRFRSYAAGVWRWDRTPRRFSEMVDYLAALPARLADGRGGAPRDLVAAAADDAIVGLEAMLEAVTD